MCVNRTSPPAVEWVLDIEVFDRITANMGLSNDILRAEAMDIDHSSLSKIRAGKFRPGRKFILGAASIGIPFDAIFTKKAAA